MGLAIAFGGMLVGTAFVIGCGGGDDNGMVQNATDPTKTRDAQDSMKSYMKQMQTKGMKPGMKSEAPAK